MRCSIAFKHTIIAISIFIIKALVIYYRILAISAKLGNR